MQNGRDRAAERQRHKMPNFPSRRTSDGRYQYEIEPGRWVSRQRVNQMRDRKANAARGLVKQLITHGLIIPQPCEKCETTDNIEAHHIDYSQPYKVQWLCRAHHLDEDRKSRGSRKLEGKPLEPPRQPGRPKGGKNYQKYFLDVSQALG
jgi:hypothetical protein